MCLWLSYKEKNKKFFFASLKSLKKGVRVGAGFESAPKCHGFPTLVRGLKSACRGPCTSWDEREAPYSISAK